MLHGMQTVLPATRQRWHSCPYPSRSWHSIKRPRRDARLSWPIWMVTYRDGILARRRTVTHPSTNWARRALTSLMRRMPPTTTPRRISCTNLLSHLRGESNQLSQFHPWIWSTEHAHCYKHTISLTTLPTHRFFWIWIFTQVIWAMLHMQDLTWQMSKLISFDWVVVLRPTQHTIGHFIVGFPSLGLV